MNADSYMEDACKNTVSFNSSLVYCHKKRVNRYPLIDARFLTFLRQHSRKKKKHPRFFVYLAGFFSFI